MNSPLEITESDYRNILIDKGVSPEDAAIIAAKTIKTNGGVIAQGAVQLGLSKNDKPKSNSEDASTESKKGKKRTSGVKQKAIIDAAVDIATNPIQASEMSDMSWGAKCLVAAALPYRNPKPEQLQNGAWVRRNGNYTLWIQCGPEGLPYGAYPRVFVIWLTTEAIRTQSRRIATGGSFWEFCRKVQIDTSRGKRGSGRRFAEQVNKLLSSRAAFVSGSFDDGNIKKDFLHFADEFDLFFDVDCPDQTNLFESEIILTEKFYNEITTHSIPLDIRAVSALRQSPFELDIYQWLAYRMHNIKGRSMPTWQQLYNQFGACHKDLRFFKRDFLKALHEVKQVYGGVRIEDNKNGLILLPSPTPVPKKSG